MNGNNIYIFIGPTLSVEQAQKYLNATYLPPVKYGDVYRITELYQPDIIGIIDGYFNQVPAVWHKEILWAIDQGITIFGASSMGALRAAELDQLGMIGCGKIYQAYQAGVLPPFIDESFEDDDEVAVIHGPAELGYQQASEAMVNIRITLVKAQQQNIIDNQELKLLTTIAKSLFYPQRNYQNILKTAEQQDIETKKLDQLTQWLEENKIDQKQLDAITMLNEIKKHPLAESTSINSNQAFFQHTSQWQSAINEIDDLHYIENPVLNEIRLLGEKYFELLDEALESNIVSQEQLTQNEFDLSKHHRTPDELNKIFAQHWQFKQGQSTANQLSSFQLDQLLLAYLKQTDHLSDFSNRAEDKKNRLNQQKNRPKFSDLTELDLLQLSDWYFTQILNTELPDQIEDYANQLGFTEIDDFYVMILDEYYYLMQNSEGG